MSTPATNHTKINLVLLHYFGGSARSWKWFTDELPHYYRVLALNLPGFGGSMPMAKRSIENFAHFVLDEIKAHNLINCVLIGHSMGAKIALKTAALDHEQRISKLVLIAPSPPTTEPMEENEKERMLNLNRQEAVKTVKKSTVIELNDDVFDTAVDTQMEIDATTWKWWIKDGMGQSIAEEVKDLPIPILVLASDDDPIMTPKIILNRVMEYLPNAELRTTINTGHLIPIEDPRWTAMMIDDYLNH